MAKILDLPLAYTDAERIVAVETFWTNTGPAGQDVSESTPRRNTVALKGLRSLGDGPGTAPEKDDPGAPALVSVVAAFQVLIPVSGVLLLLTLALILRRTDPELLAT